RLAQRHGEVIGELREGRNGGELLAVLPGTFPFNVPEEAILDDVTAQSSAEVLALEGRVIPPRGSIQTPVRGVRLIAEEAEAGAMNLVAASAGDDVDRAARSQVGARIERRTADLELLDRLVGDVRRSGAYRLVGDVHAVDLDARRTPHASAD